MTFSTHTSVNEENQWRKCTMVYLHISNCTTVYLYNPFIVRPFLRIFLHNMTFLQRFVEISTRIPLYLGRIPLNQKMLAALFSKNHVLEHQILLY